MKNIPRQILGWTLILIFLSSACGVLTRLSSDRNDGVPHTPTRMPAATAASSELSDTSLIPITGDNVVFLQCQFCVAEETHAVLIFPASAYFDVDQSSSATCLTADVVNNRRIVICRGPQETAFNISICSDPSNCLEFPVALQPCALLQGSNTAFPPVILTPISKHNSDPSQPASTPTSPPAVIPPPPIQHPGPTQEPKPTKAPKPTKEPKPTHKPKPTKKPKPHSAKLPFNNITGIYFV